MIACMINECKIKNLANIDKSQEILAFVYPHPG